MSGWVMMLLVGLLFFVLAVLAVLVIWQWQEPTDQKKQSQRPQRHAPNIVIRPRQFRTKRIVEQSAVIPAAMPRSMPPPRPTSPPRPTTPPQATAPPPRPVPRTPPPPTPSQVTAPPVAARTTPQTSLLTAMLQQTRHRPMPEPVTTVANAPRIGNTRFKVDFDTFCRRTGQVVRTCTCRGCREMRADAGI